MHGWKENGWRTSDKKPGKNKGLWLELDELNQRHEFEWNWGKEHSEHLENERSDELASAALPDLLKIDSG
jgi:ribonuclease HI